jgi:hypothetical protein
MFFAREVMGWVVLLFFYGCGLLLVSGIESAVITINTANSGPAINPCMYGIFLEEINHGVDGGLYGELIRNRGFEDSRSPEGYTLHGGTWRNSRGFDSGFSRYGYTTNGIPFWSLVQTGASKGRMSVETAGGITEQSSYCLRLDVDPAADGRVGVGNEGFFGIGVRKGEQYRLSLRARGRNFRLRTETRSLPFLGFALFVPTRSSKRDAEGVQRRRCAVSFWRRHGKFF